LAQLHRYGSIDPFFFKLTLSGVAVAGVTFDAADVKLSKDGAAFANIGTACAEATGGLGWYKWTPAAAANTQCKIGIINIKDNVGTLFDENGVVFVTGGDASAQHDGT